MLTFATCWQRSPNLGDPLTSLPLCCPQRFPAVLQDAGLKMAPVGGKRTCSLLTLCSQVKFDLVVLLWLNKRFPPAVAALQ